jgi:hypothetical protein
MKPIELSIPDKAYRWCLATWCAMVAGLAIALGTHALRNALPPPEPIERQANGRLGPELRSLRLENTRLKQIVRELDTNHKYTAEISN